MNLPRETSSTRQTATTTKPALDLASRGLDGLVLDFVRIYEVVGVDGNIVQELSAVDKFDVVAGVLMEDLCDVVFERLTLLVDRQDLVHSAQLEEGLGAVTQNQKGKQGSTKERGQKAKNDVSAAGEIETRGEI